MCKCAEHRPRTEEIGQDHVNERRFGRANRDVDLSSSLPSLAALQFRMLRKSGRELEQRLKYCAIESARAIVVFDTVKLPKTMGWGWGSSDFLDMQAEVSIASY